MEMNALKMQVLANDAAELVAGERRTDYGEAEASFHRIAEIWSGVLGHGVSAKDVALCMAGLKLYREANKAKRDNRLDAIGYILLAEAMS